MANSPAFAGTGVAVSLPAEPTFDRMRTQDTFGSMLGRVPVDAGASAVAVRLEQPAKTGASQSFAMAANDLRQICVGLCPPTLN